jgi:hypothetical protein
MELKPIFLYGNFVFFQSHVSHLTRIRNGEEKERRRRRAPWPIITTNTRKKASAPP